MATLVAVVIAPTAASALLTNEYGQHFAGSAVCAGCHQNPAYGATSHGEFAVPEAVPAASPTAGAGIWPAGRIDAGETLEAEDVGFTLGAGTGIREYVAQASLLDGVDFTPAGNSPFAMVNGLEWEPDEANDFEYALDDYNPAANGIQYGSYNCSQCHQLGVVRRGVKPVAGNFTTTTGTADTWAIPEGSDATAFASYIPGSSIQCERCHGTGLDAATNGGNHFGAGVQIVGFNSLSASSHKLLDSQVCGQCHGSFKPGGNIVGFTPDQTITAFVPNEYHGTTVTANAFGPTRVNDVPSEAAFEASSGLRASTKFFPNGENKSLKHVYYTEWAMSGHSWRGRLTSISPNATPFQQAGTQHFTMNTGGADQVKCDRCHTGEGFLKRKLSVGAPLGNIMASVPEVASAQGNLGTECADCHISHGATTTDEDAIGMATRAPEKANGAFSTNGLNVDNKSLCEDCHNWQLEVMADGGSVVAALPTTIRTGVYARHPQREIYHGRAMLEVPTAKDFMPGAKCEQCHMPATRSDFPEKTHVSRYDDRSFKRYSHRMFIMEPGDAEAWGLAPWGDSCSPCHADHTQGYLQDKIDGWQSTAADLAAAADTAIGAAQTRGDATSAGDVDLLKRATANLSLYVQDTSGGVHNPPYEQAGLTKAAELAASAGGDFEFLVAPGNVAPNQAFSIAGTLENGDDTFPADATVTLWDGATQVGETTTDDNGNFAFMLAQTATTKTYTVKWERSSVSVSDVSETVRVEVEKAPASVTLKRSSSSVAHGAKVRLYGDLNPDAASPASIRIQYKKPGSSSWVTWRTVSAPAPSGDYTTTWSTSSSTKRGTWSWRSYYGGSASFLTDYSSTVTVRIR